MSAWQLIEGAPLAELDGKELLVWDPTIGEVVMGYYLAPDEDTPGDEGWYWADSIDTGPCDPTHWMFYPDPPESA